MLPPQEGTNTGVESQANDTSTLVDTICRANQPLEAKKAQRIVDMLDLVRQIRNMYLR